MAEIPIERKESRNWLPLILGLLALLLLLGFCFLRRSPDTAARPADSTAVAATPAISDSAGGTMAGAGAAGAATGGANGAIDQFAQFVQQRDTTQETEGQHAYTAEGTRRLAAALDAIAGSSTPNIGVYADSMRSSIDRLQRSSPQDVHADDAKAAFSAAVSAMAQIDQARGRTRDVAPMRAIYNQLDSKRPLLQQLGTVNRFFEAARDALIAMRA